MSKSKIHIVIYIVIVIFLGCNKEEDNLPDNKNDTNSYSSLLILNDLKISGDTVNLSWSKSDKIYFKSLYIARKTDYSSFVNPYAFDFDNRKIISGELNVATNSFIDNHLPTSSYVEYQIVGKDLNNKYVFSNKKTIERPQIKEFTINPFQLIAFSNNKVFILNYDGSIYLYNIDSQLIEKTLQTNANIGYGCILNENNLTKLVIPREDGWIYLYDTETLIETKRINISFPCTSVIANNNRLYITANRLVVFDIPRNRIISNANTSQRLFMIPGSNTEFYGLYNVSTIMYYSFNSNGEIQTQKSGYSDNSNRSLIGQVLPDNSIIVSDYGTIFKKDLSISKEYLQIELNNITSFSDFATEPNGKILYCANSYEKSISLFTFPDLKRSSIINTLGYPYKMCVCGNWLFLLENIEIRKETFDLTKKTKLIFERIKLE